jgi:type IV pilus assembly protein PilC
VAIAQEFSYRAVDPRGGSVIKGAMEAASESAVTGKLRAQGLTPLEIKPLSKTGLNREIRLPGLGGTVKAKSLALFTRQMAGLLKAGLPLMRTLAILIEQTDDKKLQPALVKVQADVESGSSLSQALARHTNVFPPLMISIVRVGETGGFLARLWTRSPRTTRRSPSFRTRSVQP